MKWMFSSCHIVALGGLVLLTKIWIDVCEIWKHQIKMNTYVRISASAVDILKILRDESQVRRRRLR